MLKTKQKVNLDRLLGGMDINFNITVDSKDQFQFTDITMERLERLKSDLKFNKPNIVIMNAEFKKEAFGLDKVFHFVLMNVVGQEYRVYNEDRHPFRKNTIVYKIIKKGE